MRKTKKPLSLEYQLAYAVIGDDVGEVRRLLEAGANPNTREEIDSDGNNYSLLHIACSHCQGKIAELLIRHGARVKTSTKGGYSPLHAAVYYTMPDTIRLMVEKGANINRYGKNAAPPLHDAVQSGSIDMVELLVELGADVSQVYKGKTALEYVDMLVRNSFLWEISSKKITEFLSVATEKAKLERA
ncbi:MAG TPA: ankyrin repeat domain-containing protein, partial [Anaerovoracaceae bacterium]|nr:ankyrin repeat domain-containing protein [Anaerovoracaceae bacterium]